jgi:hypothetical protein
VTSPEDHARLDERRRGHAQTVRGQHAVDPIEMSGFSEENRDERRRVERHAPLGP